MELPTSDLSLSRIVDILKRQPPQRTPADLRKLATYLRSLDGFFHSLDQLDVEIIGKWLSYEFVPAGEPVYREGEFGESMYIILSGTCDVFPVAGSRLPSDTGLLHMGQAFGELALVAARKPRSRTVAASTAGGGSSSGPAQQQGGVHLATLHRSSLSHMRFVAAASADAGRALQSVLAACCMGVLRVPPGSRTQEEVDTLAEFFGVMEAFKKLPGDMVRRLAADAGHVRLPAGRLAADRLGSQHPARRRRVRAPLPGLHVSGVAPLLPLHRAHRLRRRRRPDLYGRAPAGERVQRRQLWKVWRQWKVVESCGARTETGTGTGTVQSMTRVWSWRSARRQCCRTPPLQLRLRCITPRAL